MIRPTPKKIAQYIYDHSYIESETTGGPDGFDSDLIYHFITMADNVSFAVSVIGTPNNDRTTFSSANDEEFMTELYDCLRALAHDDKLFKQALLESTIFELEDIEGLPIED